MRVCVLYVPELVRFLNLQVPSLDRLMDNQHRRQWGAIKRHLEQLLKKKRVRHVHSVESGRKSGQVTGRPLELDFVSFRPGPASEDSGWMEKHPVGVGLGEGGLKHFTLFFPFLLLPFLLLLLLLRCFVSLYLTSSSDLERRCFHLKSSPREYTVSWKAGSLFFNE